MTQAALQIESSTSPLTGEIEAVVVPTGLRSAAIDEAIRKHIEPACARSSGQITIDQVFYLLDQEKAQAFVAVENREIVAAVITEVFEYVSGLRSLRLMLAGGYGTLRTAMTPLLAKIEEFAVLSICSSVIIEGRKGWERTIPEEYRFMCKVFEKEIL